MESGNQFEIILDVSEDPGLSQSDAELSMIKYLKTALRDIHDEMPAEKVASEIIIDISDDEYSRHSASPDNLFVELSDAETEEQKRVNSFIHEYSRNRILDTLCKSHRCAHSMWQEASTFVAFKHSEIDVLKLLKTWSIGEYIKSSIGESIFKNRTSSGKPGRHASSMSV